MKSIKVRVTRVRNINSDSITFINCAHHTDYFSCTLWLLRFTASVHQYLDTGNLGFISSSTLPITNNTSY